MHASLLRRAFGVFLVVLSFCAIVVLVPATGASAAGTPDITFDLQATKNILFGEQATVTLVAADPVGQPYAYNVSYRVVLPAGVSYVGGQTTPAQAGEPTTIANQPTAGETTLTWTNVSDIAPNGSASLSFKIQLANTAPAGLIQVGDTFSLSGGAYVNSDARFVPDFDAAGQPVAGASSYTGSAVDTGTTTVSAVKVDIAEPNPEGEIMRGVHANKTTYALTVTNNHVNTTNGITLDAWIPAALEYLACGDDDNTTEAPTNPGDAVEYPGAADLTDGDGASPTSCDTPTSVDTVTVDPDGAGPLTSQVWTHVQWPIGSLAASATKVVKYLAAVPIRENTMAWIGGAAPTAVSLDQASNLDNNSGAETADEQQLVTYSTVEGTYTGTLGGGSNPVDDDDTNTRTAEDIRLLKGVDDGTIGTRSVDTWSLTIKTSEYRTVQNIVLSDTLPDGLCPLDDVAEREDATQDDPAECEAAGGNAPSLAYASATENADGTYSMTWNVPDMGADAQTVVTYKAQVRDHYQENFVDTTPVVGMDAWTNQTALTADDYVICANGDTTCAGGQPKIDHTEVDATPDVDASSAGQSAPAPAITKQVSLNTPGSALDCATAAYAASADGYRPGDKVCWKLRVDFPADVMTRNPVVADFIPPGTSYIAGSAAVTGNNTVTTTTPSLAGDPLTWALRDTTIGSDAYVDEGKVFELTFATLIGPTRPAPGTFDLVDNLMKLSAQNTAGTAIALRDDAEFSLGDPHLGLTKIIVDVDGVAEGDDTATAHQTQVVTYQVAVANDGKSLASDVEIWDKLPSGIACGDVSAISDGGSCASGIIKWASIASVAAGATKDLTYDVTIPSGAATGPAAGQALVNHAGVRRYYSLGNGGADGSDTGVNYTLTPASNIDTTLTTTNTDPADDTATVTMSAPTITKGLSTEVNETGNSAGTQATKGEELTYTVTFTVPAHTSLYSGSLTDTLPSTVSANGTATATFDGGALPGGTSVSTNSGTITLDFGASYQNATNATQSFVATIPAKVKVSGGPSRGTTVTNTATFNGRNSDGTNRTALSASKSFTAVEPVLSVNKAHNDADNIVNPGQTVTYSVGSANGSAANTSTAHDLTMDDVVPAGLTVDTGTISNGGTYDAGTRTIHWDIASLAPGGTSTSTYQAVVDTLPIGATSYTNTVSLSGTGLPDVIDDDGEATYGPLTASKTVTAPKPSVTKSASPTIATPGETATFTLSATIPADIILNDATVIDHLPDGMTFVSYGSATCTTCPVPADTITPTQMPAASRADGSGDAGWFLGDLAASAQARTVTFSITARVDLTYNDGSTLVDRGDVLTDSFNIYWNNSNGTDPVTIPATPGTAFDRSGTGATATVTVVEPEVGIDKDLTGQTGDTDTMKVVPGQALTYTIAASNPSGGNHSSAYDIDITDTPDSELTNVVVPTGAGYTITDGWTAGDPDIKIHIDGPIAPGATWTLSYTADVKGSTSLDTTDTAVNTAVVDTYYGVDHDNPPTGYRTYTVGNPDSDTVTADIDFPSISIVKTTGAGTETANAEVLQSFGWRIAVTNAGSTAATAFGFDVKDTLPADWTYVPGTAQLNGGALADPTITTHAAGDDLVWTDLSNLVPGATATVTFSAKPQAAAGLVSGAQVNTASATAEDLTGATGNHSGAYSSGTDTASATVRVPTLGVTKTPDGGATRTGAAASWTITVNNSGSVAARNVTVKDTFPSTFTYTPSGATATPLPIAGETASGTAVTWTIASIAGGASTTLTVPGTVATGLAEGTTISNSVAVTSQELTTTVTDTGSLVLGPTSDLSLTKTISNPTPVANEDVTYTITISNAGLDTATSVAVKDVLPAQVTYVSSAGSGTYAAGTGIWTVGSLTSGQSKSIDLTVTVKAPTLGDPSPVPNVAEISASGSYDPDSTPNNDQIGEDDRDVANFTVIPGASIGDLVWHDIDGDGQQSGGEPGKSGVTVKLLNAGGTTVRTTTTDGSGGYLFAGLPPGSYRVEVVPPAGWRLTTPDQGADASDSDVDTTTHRSALVAVVSGQNLLTLDAGLHQPATIGDHVWIDGDQDGVQDAGELPLPGVTVKLRSGGAVVATTVTDASGDYSFVGVNPATYQVEFVQPSGYVFSRKDFGADVTDSDADEHGMTGDIVITSNEVVTTVDAGLFVAVVPPSLSLGNLVWHDLDADGVLDPGEPGVPGVTVHLLADSGQVLKTTTTDANGGYLFTDLGTGRYRVEFIDPSGWTMSPSQQGSSRDLDSNADAGGRTASLDVTVTDLSVDAGMYRPATLGDRVWRDVDGDGVQDPGEVGIGGVRLQLVDPDGAVVATTTTASDGTYVFDHLRPGTYAVVVVPRSLPAGLHQTFDPDGTLDGRASHTLADGATYLQLDFGFRAGAAPATTSTTVPGGTATPTSPHDVLGEHVEGPGIALKKSLGSKLVTGHEALYLLTVRNIGTVDDPGPMTLIDSLPDGLQFVGPDSSGWRCAAAGSQVTCDADAGLAVGATTVLRLKVLVTAKPGTTLINRATVSGISAMTVDFGSGVLGESEEVGPDPAVLPAGLGSLPFTGAPALQLSLLALVLLGAGGGLVLLGRRRRRV